MSKKHGDFTNKAPSEEAHPIADRETLQQANKLKQQWRRELRNLHFLVRDISIGLMILVPVVFMAFQFFYR